jgi:shikimate kinase
MAAFPFSAVFLTGFMGAGKSSVGRALSQRLDWRFVDLDEAVAARAGKSIREIFAESGEREFRSLESVALAEIAGSLSAESPMVIALGGGTLTQPANREVIRSTSAPLIFLEAPVEQLWQRCQGAGRPLANDLNQFRQLYEERYPHYTASSIRVQCGVRPAEAVAAEIEDMLRRSPAPE